MSIARLSVQNPVLVNLLMIGLFIFGGISLLNMPLELNSPVSFNWVFINIPYPGASAEEVESLIIDPIESEIKDVEDIDEIQSDANEGLAFILVKFEDMSDDEFRNRYLDLKAEIDKVILPDNAEDPLIDDFNSEDFQPVINVNMVYQIPEANAAIIADEIEEDLLDMPGVAKAQVSGLAEREIWIEVSPEKLLTYRIRMDEVVAALQSRNLNVPGGNISLGKNEYLIRSIGLYKKIDAIENTIVRTSPDGNYIRIKDVARVKDTRAEMDILSRINGKSSITFSISKKSDANSLDVIDRVKSMVQEYRMKVPDGVDFVLTSDTSVYILDVVNTLRNNALLGMVLIFFILLFFLGRSNALLASLGIPISFFITFIFMDFGGQTLNGNTLFALVMVLGIVVDDAIIVLENCHRYRMMGYNSFQSAIMGTNEVMAPIISSIATNIAAFLPLMLLPGIMGKFMRIIPIVFSLALLASLFEAFILLPSHYADWTIKSKVFQRGEFTFFVKLRYWYEVALAKVLRRRYLVATSMVSILIVSTIVVIPLLGVELYGTEEFNQFSVLIRNPEGTSLEECDRITKKFESAALSLESDAIKDVIVNVGLLQGNESWDTKRSVSQVLVELVPKDQRTVSTDELMAELRQKTAGISGPISVSFEKLAGGPPVGKPISVKVQGKYMQDIKAASIALQDSLRSIVGAEDISDDYPPGKQEIRIDVNDDKAALYGLSTQYVAMNVRYAFDGITATEYRDGDDEVDVVVKYAETSRQKVNDVLDMKIVNMAGQAVALRDVVSFSIEPGPTIIRRFDQKRTIIVSGNINEDLTSIDKINLRLEQMFPSMEERFAGIDFKIGGQFEEFVNVFKDISMLFALALILIFVILGTQFNSYTQPLVILTTVPFALIGAVLGLLVSQNPFSIVAMFGIVALAGIVVNDAIILITFMNNRRRGLETTTFQLWRSIIDAGRLRLRPIILTSMTTILGLFPMAIGLGGSSETWSPLANVILFGLLISTILTLFIIPCFLAILDDIHGYRKQAALELTADQRHYIESKKSIELKPKELTEP